MTDAAPAAGATQPSGNWVRSELKCTKARPTACPRLDLIIHHYVTNFSKLTLPESAKRLAPLVAARGDADTSVSVVMGEAIAGVSHARRHRHLQECRRRARTHHVGLRGPEALEHRLVGVAAGRHEKGEMLGGLQQGELGEIRTIVVDDARSIEGMRLAGHARLCTF